MNRITDDIIYVGVNDYETDLFENQYPVREGMTYNSYVVLDDKTLVAATTEQKFIDVWMENTAAALDGRNPDYLLIQHMEPDHSSAVEMFMEKYPQCVIVASKPALNMMKNYFGTDYPDRNLAIKEGDVLNLGRHELVFTGAPMVHWPEVMLAYDKTEKVLFSSDAFGRFGAPSDPAQDAASPEYEAQEWFDEARRYYTGIVGKFGDSVVKAFEKVSAFDIRIICPLHGPVLTRDLQKYIDVHIKWATYTPEEKGIAICYSSVYGHTREAVDYLAEVLKGLDKGLNHCEPENKGKLKLELYDLARCDVSAAVAAAFRYDRVVLATTTYNNGIFPCMKEFLDHLAERNFQKRKVGIIENGSWGPKAASLIKGILENCRDVTLCENTVTIKSAMNEANRAQLIELAKELTD